MQVARPSELQTNQELTYLATSHELFEPQAKTQPRSRTCVSSRTRRKSKEIPLKLKESKRETRAQYRNKGHELPSPTKRLLSNSLSKTSHQKYKGSNRCLQRRAEEWLAPAEMSSTSRGGEMASPPGDLTPPPSTSSIMTKLQRRERLSQKLRGRGWSRVSK